MKPRQDIVILDGARTPMADYNGVFSDVSAIDLAVVAAKEALRRAGVEPAAIDHVIFGNALQTSADAIYGARHVALKAGVPKEVPALTVNRLCGSGFEAVAQGADRILLGDAETVLVGGMENMTQAPHVVRGARKGFRLGGAKLEDSLYEALLDSYSGLMMAQTSDRVAEKYGVTREEQDAFALESYKRAQAATKNGLFADEITPVEIPQKKGDPVKVDADEEPFAAPLEKMPSLKPAFQKDGSVTAANSSKINDGAAALVVTSAEKAKAKGWRPIARIVASTGVAQAPEWFTTAPVGAMKKLVEKTGVALADVDLFEINEAFAAVAMAAIRDLSLDPAKVNVRGGAVALGHPIGASGARILTTLVHALRREHKKRGIAAICIGGGEATAMLVEAV
jgi:acetyl-CoA acetyltransferase family protein